MRFCFVISLLLLGVASSAAQTVTMGLGAATCSQFASDYRRAPKTVETAYFGWAQGFLSGHNFAVLAHAKDSGVAPDLKSLSIEEQQAFIRQYCDSHPLGNYMDAVLDLYWKLIGAQTLPRKR